LHLNLAVLQFIGCGDIKVKNHKAQLYAHVVFVLTVCGNSYDSDPAPSSYAEPTEVYSTGILLDISLISIGCRTVRVGEATNSQGEDEYGSGETATLLIGHLEFPTPMAKSTVTPLRLA
tara:strand:- start:8105 stop:8461 length:357 start_codon:yes stop_codon:yes gene_type:complete